MRILTDEGDQIALGLTEATPTISLINYSRRETDDFGVTTVVERGFSRRLSLRTMVPFEHVDRIQRVLAELRGTAVTWVADEDLAWLRPRGFYRDFSLDLAVPPASYCTLSVEGIAEAEAVADPGGDPAPDGIGSTLQILRPIEVTDANLTSSSVPENDAPAWGAATSYGEGAKAASGHRVYESLVSGNVGNAPATTPDKWLDTGPANRWAMFDAALGTETVASGSIAVSLSLGGVTAVALLDVVGATARVQCDSYDRTQPIGPGALTFLDLPGGSGPVTVTIVGPGVVSIGTMLAGTLALLGTTEASPNSSISDYSRKEVDDFGEVTIVQRSWAKKMTARALIRSNAIDIVADRLAAIRARPVLWIGQSGVDSLTVYGFFRDFSIEVGSGVSKLSLSIEGLSKADRQGTSLGKLLELAKTSTETAQAAADAAQATADAAKAQGDAALAQIGRNASDGWLDGSDKRELIRLWADAANERPLLAAQAQQLGVGTSVYVGAYDALSAYLGSLSPAWNNTALDTAIVPATFNGRWSDYVYARTGLTNAIAGEAAKHANFGQISGVPTELTDGRIGAGLTPGGNLQGGLVGGGPAVVSIASVVGGVQGTQLALNSEFQRPDLSAGPFLYNNAGSDKVVLSRIALTGAPNGSGFVLRIAYDGTGAPGTSVSPGFGGCTLILYPTDGSSTPGYFTKGSKVSYRIWARIPVGRVLNWTSNATGDAAVGAWVTPQVGTGDWSLYVYEHQYGRTGSFGSTGFVYITDGPNSAFSWDVAKFEAVDITSSPRTFMGPQFADEFGVARYRSDVVTPYGTAAAIAGQGFLATQSYVADGRLTGALANRLAPHPLNANYLSAVTVAYPDGAGVNGLQPGEAGSNKTETRTAAAFVGQGPFATVPGGQSLDNGGLFSMPARLLPFSGDSNYLVATRIAWSDGDTVQNYKPQEGGSNRTETRTAAAITGQAAWATYNGLVPGVVAGQVSRLYGDGYMPDTGVIRQGVNFLSNVWPAEFGSNVTENRTAAAIAGQGAFATITQIDLTNSDRFTFGGRFAPLDNGDGNYFNAARIQYGNASIGYASVESLKPMERGSNATEPRTAAAIAGQGALATQSMVGAAYVGFQVGRGNRLRNGSFEDYSGVTALGFYPYLSGEGSPALAIAPGRAGGIAQRVTWASNNFGVRGIYLGDAGPKFNNTGVMVANSTQVWSFWARAEGSGVGQPMVLRWNQGPVLMTPIANPPLSNQWQFYAFKLVWGGSVNANGFLSVQEFSSGAAGLVDIDDMAIEFGEIPTGYSPATAYTDPLSGRMTEQRGAPINATMNLRYAWPSQITYSASGNTATISVGAATVSLGDATVSFGAMSAGVSEGYGQTILFDLYFDVNPVAPYAGGTFALIATTDFAAKYRADSRIWIGAVYVTFPAPGEVGGGTGTGGGGGGLKADLP